MKKFDKLIITSFLGPFFLTFCVVVFILLLQFLLKYFEDLVGKGLGLNIYAQLLGYFAINMTPNAFPLAVLLSSLITFGNLGEHSELTAIKSSGVSLLRVLSPIFIISIILTILAYISNNYIVPKANLKAYSLLWDIKNKTPALNLKEGTFYGDIPGYQIKVAKKFPDRKTLKGIIIYNHSQNPGNNEVTLADSGQMYTILNNRYLVMDLYDGRYYSEEENPVRTRFRSPKASPFARNQFRHSRIIFSMASFDLKRTREELFKSNRVMKNVMELRHDADSMGREIKYARYEGYLNYKLKFNAGLGKQLIIPDEILPKSYGYEKRGNDLMDNRKFPETTSQKSNRPNSAVQKPVGNREAMRKIPRINDRFNRLRKGEDSKYPTRKISPIPETQVRKIEWEKIGADSILNGKFNNIQILKIAVTDARFVKNNFMMSSGKVAAWDSEVRSFNIQKFKIIAQAFACIIMFLIGAPLGSIMKKGGLGFPVLVSIGFFIVYYVFMIMGEKWAKQVLMTPFIGVWMPNFVLLPIGLIFLFQARKDAKMFDADYYYVVIENAYLKFMKWMEKKG